MIYEWAVPLRALSIDADSLVGGAEREKRVNLEISAALNDCPSDETSLRDAHNVDLLASEVGIVVQLVADGRCLPLHTLENGRDHAIADLDTFDDGLVVNRL